MYAYKVDCISIYKPKPFPVYMESMGIVCCVKKGGKKGYAPLFPFIVQSIASYQTISDWKQPLNALQVKITHYCVIYDIPFPLLGIAVPANMSRQSDGKAQIGL